MTAPTDYAAEDPPKTVAGKTVTLTPEQADAFGRELDASERARHRRPRRARRQLHPPDHQGAARSGGRRPRTAVRRHLPAVLARRAPRCWASAKILDNMEIGHNVMHGQYDWMRRSGAVEPEVRMGHRLPVRPVAALAQLHAPHLHQHRRHGPRHRLRHPADERGPEVGPVLPGQPGLRVPADGAVPVRRRAARAGDRAHPRRRDHDRATSARSCEGIWRKTASRRSRTTWPSRCWPARSRRLCSPAT